ncbi:unnamed protein product (mitochondrion) [Plasmodiophora brassicae]|uniref:EF-hand domain-containing protein n=1 Tax=Plasmodiophora brassicae TaxID=37360 RepID=A0A0G4J437_PLABS|nr:hypothetical protein PBRA_008987 [Plasmodiophora brassicae]SPQ95772.1 unnamed protein product [Plasmodiophora brassicae]
MNPSSSRPGERASTSQVAPLDAVVTIRSKGETRRGGVDKDLKEDSDDDDSDEGGLTGDRHAQYSSDEGEGTSTTLPAWTNVLRCRWWRPSKEADLSRAGLSEVEIEELKMISPFDDKYLRRLCARYLRMDTRRRGYITLSQMMKMGEFQLCPFRDRMAEVFRAGLKSSRMTFQDFAQTLAVFSRGTPRDHKIRFLYKVYDADGDGVVSRMDLLTTLRAVVDGIGKDGLVEQIVDKILEECDPENSGTIAFREFREALIETDIDMRVNLIL